MDELVVVLETAEPVELAMVKGLLEDAGIPLYVDGRIALLIQDIDPFLHKSIRLEVPADREAEAREILEQFRHPIPPDEAA